MGSSHVLEQQSLFHGASVKAVVIHCFGWVQFWRLTTKLVSVYWRRYVLNRTFRAPCAGAFNVETRKAERKSFWLVTDEWKSYSLLMQPFTELHTLIECRLTKQVYFTIWCIAHSWELVDLIWVL
jgi:hypothetical protein